jgi:hypothetical protein
LNIFVMLKGGSSNKFKETRVSVKPPPIAPKPRPWSVVGGDRKSGMLLSHLNFIHSIITVTILKEQ